MSRLADRIRENCQPAKISLMYQPHELDNFIRQQAAASPDYNKVSKEEIDSIVQEGRAYFPSSLEKFDKKNLNDIPVFAADDVAHYTSSLPQGTSMSDVVASMAPPFDKFFIEFQHVPNDKNFYAWGTLITVRNDLVKMAHEDRSRFEENEIPRWILLLDSFLEREKGKPFGPVTHSILGLAEDGTWFHHPSGNLFWQGGLTEFDEPQSPEFIKMWLDFISQLSFPILLTLSFLHCKNIEVRTVVPPEKLSLKYRKNTGRDLVKYHVLDIAPMRKILDRYRKGTSDDLRRALHICRGHFKIFTEDAPLMGKHVGTFWWTPQVRGSKDAGVVLKDYRVSAPVEFGKAYRDADENPPEASKEAPLAKDPDSAGRGLAAHSKTQNKIAEILSAMGHVPRSPSQNEPEYDLAWKAAETLFVCEVKSITLVNEERQLRMAIGQVIRYRQKMAAAGYEPVMAVIAAECQPKDSTWDELCVHEGILLVWPDVAEGRFKEMDEKIVDSKNS